MRILILISMALALHPAHAGDEFENRDLIQGQALYAAQCAACHGADLEGEPNWRIQNADGTLPAPPHDETGHTWHHDNQLLFDYTLLGGAGALEARGVTGVKSAMPAFQGILTEDEVWTVLAYIRSTWPAEVQEIQDGLNAPHE